MIWEGCRTHRVVSGLDGISRSQDTFFFSMLPGFWGTWLPSKHFN